ncbi:hypothetical protein [Paraliomyxa miuraensis]|uniref:hypothetical protein n=1 Tax=Paraliomyxa miuraensis TaxID=376150 RepID=UPI00224D4F39|nr:hypothetical protein [Paraliomyxa miuraensis]MCX4242195.1 hypothetical protein [Paraliomyxa miuraensis]
MLPITSVVLFKHGVGYFERHGKISGEASVELSFRQSEMNDVLKSLTVLDHDGGLVSSISYESTQPLSRQLEDFAIHIPEGHAISGLLGQLTGTRVVVHRADGRGEGVVAGVEPFSRREGEAIIESHRLSLWVEGMALESHDLADIRRIELADAALRKDLQHLLDILISAKKKDLKRLTIFSRGEGERQMSVSYVIETPVWKTSYRVLLYGEGESRSTAVQGWAVVDNTGDEDWNEVELTLVAGLPISFVHDLYSPRYKRRPVVVVQEEAAYAPPVLEHGFGGGGMLAEEPMAMPAAAAPVPRAPGAPPPPPAPARGGTAARSRSAPPPPPPQAVTTRTQEVGDLLHYTIDNPVTVRRKQSALVPILHRDFLGKRIAIYNPDVREQNPMSALLFKNTTGLTLEGGPLTVIEDGAYIGEAMLETIKPDEERVIPFSVELGCRIAVDHRSELTDVHRARIVNGSLWLHRYRLQRKIYVIANKTDRPIDLFLDHRFVRGYELEGTPEPVERTESFYRFRFDVAAKTTHRFTVTEKGEEHQSHAIGSTNLETFGVWLKHGYVDPATHAALARIAGLAAEVAQLRHRASAHEATIKSIFENQGRLRENLRALGSAADERKLRERYVAELADEEDRLAALRQEIAALEAERETKEQSMRDEIAGLSFDSARG